MRSGITLLVAAAVVTSAAWAVAQQSQTAGHDPAPWHVGEVVRLNTAPHQADRVPAGDSKDYLYVRVRFNVSAEKQKKHRFRVTDGSVKEVGELYGYDRSRPWLVFGGSWESLAGLYLDGIGHREPLFRVKTAPPPQTVHTPPVVHTPPPVVRTPPVVHTPPLVERRPPAPLQGRPPRTTIVVPPETRVVGPSRVVHQGGTTTHIDRGPDRVVHQGGGTTHVHRGPDRVVHQGGTTTHVHEGPDRVVHQGGGTVVHKHEGGTTHVHEDDGATHVHEGPGGGRVVHEHEGTTTHVHEGPAHAGPGGGGSGTGAGPGAGGPGGPGQGTGQGPGQGGPGGSGPCEACESSGGSGPCADCGSPGGGPGTGGSGGPGGGPGGPGSGPGGPGGPGKGGPGGGPGMGRGMGPGGGPGGGGPGGGGAIKGLAPPPDDPAFVLYVATGDETGPGKVYQVDEHGRVLGWINLPYTPTGLALHRDNGLVAAIPRDGGKIMRIDDTGKVSTLLDNDQTLVHPVDVAMGGKSDTVLVADNISDVMAATTSGGTVPKVYKRVEGQKWAAQSMSIAVANDKSVIFGTDGDEGIYRLSGDDTSNSGEPILPGPGGVAADPKSLRWAATQDRNQIYVFEGQELVKKLRLPPNKSAYRQGLLSFSPCGSLCVAMRDSDQVVGQPWLYMYDVDEDKRRSLFPWAHETMTDFVVGPRMFWDRRSPGTYRSTY